MNRCVFVMMLTAMLLPAAAVVAQEFEPEEAEFHMEMREREMELEQRQAEMEFKRRMSDLELEKHKLELERLGKARKHKQHPLLLLVVIVHILTAVWVYKDIRQRGSGSGLWIVIALLTGLLGTLVYAVVRLGNGEKKKA